MATYSKKLLSGSTNGKGIKVVATETLGTTIHTASLGTSILQEIWLYAHNTNTTSVVLTIEWGGVSDPDNIISVTVPGQSGIIPIIPGFLLQNELVISAFANVANKVVIYGFVNEIGV